MKRSARSTLLLASATHLARADFQDGRGAVVSAPRPSEATPVDAIRAAVALGGKLSGATWVLTEEAWAQKVTLNPAQIAGLNPEQLRRALSFEVEPFSGVPVGDSVLGFQQLQAGVFSVVEIAKAERDGMQAVIEKAGGRLAGLTSATGAPAQEDALEHWLRDRLAELEEGKIPVILPSVPVSSVNRFWLTSAIFEAVAAIFVIGYLESMVSEKKELEQRNAELASATRELDAVKRQVVAKREELGVLEKEHAQRERIGTRRGALFSLLNGLAATRPEEVVVRSLQAEGPSTLIVSGLALEAGAVDEMSIALTDTLRSTGWTAQPRHKSGTKRLPTGGPWEFSLTLTHVESIQAAALRLSQRGSE